MCIFSHEVEYVGDTKIFARRGSDPLQYLVYEMALTAPVDLAMILPIPTQPNSTEDSIRFIDMSGYKDFFKDLEKGFPKDQLKGMLSRGGDRSFSFNAPLQVHQVGAFEASFVPTLSDFSRLDPRFRLEPTVWDKIPQYKDYGFVVFKLRGTNKPKTLDNFHESERASIHPMAFSFPSRYADQLFFPTMHIHDGQIHEQAYFDHTLYFQKKPGPMGLTVRKSYANVGEFMKFSPVLDPMTHAYRTELRGKLVNNDFLI